MRNACTRYVRRTSLVSLCYVSHGFWLTFSNIRTNHLMTAALRSATIVQRRTKLAGWAQPYLEFHEQPYEAPVEPILPPPVRCRQCDEVFEDHDARQAHMFHAHPFDRPVLILRGRMCSDARMIVAFASDPSDWESRNCESATIDDVEVAVEDLGAELSTRSGVVVVVLDSGRAKRRYEFDIDVPTTSDLEGVDRELAVLIGEAELDLGTIDAFIDRCAPFRTAGRYADGVADYLYWRAWRSREARSGEQAQYEDKLNKSAHILAGFDRPAARAIVSRSRSTSTTSTRLPRTR